MQQPRGRRYQERAGHGDKVSVFAVRHKVVEARRPGGQLYRRNGAEAEAVLGASCPEDSTAHRRLQGRDTKAADSAAKLGQGKL